MTTTAQKATHSPGPWESTEHFSDEQHDGHLIVDAHGCGVCSVWHSQFRQEQEPEEDANAALLAAAPDLLEACRRALLAIDTGFLRQPEWESLTLEEKRASRQQSVYDQLAAAIAKAGAANAP